MVDSEVILQRLTAVEASVKSIDEKMDNAYPTNVMINLMLEPIRNDVIRVTAAVDSYMQKRSNYENQLKIAIVGAVVSPFVAMITTILATIVLNGGIDIS